MGVTILPTGFECSRRFAVLASVLANGVVGGMAVRGDLHPVLVQSHFLLAMVQQRDSAVQLRLELADALLEFIEGDAVSPSAVSHHLSELRAIRLVCTRREGNQIFYSIDDSHVDTMVEVLFPVVRQSQPWNKVSNQL